MVQIKLDVPFCNTCISKVHVATNLTEQALLKFFVYSYILGSFLIIASGFDSVLIFSSSTVFGLGKYDLMNVVIYNIMITDHPISKIYQFLE